jgi:hypothetical protein
MGEISVPPRRADLAAALHDGAISRLCPSRREPFWSKNSMRGQIIEWKASTDNGLKPMLLFFFF